MRTALIVTLLTAVPAWADEPSKEDLEFFEKKIRPLLAETCFECHGADKQKANLRLDSRDAVLKGGDSGPAVKAGSPDESLLMEAVNYTGDTQMPPKGKLDDEKINDLKDWIQRGAPWPREKPKDPKPPVEEFDLAGRKAKQWALQPVRRVEPPAVSDPDWHGNAIDRFLMKPLDQAGLRPAPRADKRTLLRRVSYDLIGLPPTVEETNAFLADSSTQAFEKVVDRLLASPHYGERWARHWLDLVRFAETRGHEFDFEIPHAFEYRDYVIRALNSDVPYDQFVVEHLAGDLLANPRRDPTTGINESVIGTGFWFLGEAKHSPVDILGDEADRVDNQIDVFGKTFLACTLGCARCHDHKFDAIAQTDYYAMAGYIQSSRYEVTSIDPPEQRREIVRDVTAMHTQRQEAVTASIQQHLKNHPPAGYLAAALYGLEPNAVSTKSLAERRKLDEGVLSAWIQRLKRAETDQDDPLHPWTRLRRFSTEPDKLTADHFAAWKRELPETVAALANVKAVDFEDFGESGWNDWFVSGEAFGAGPLQAPWAALEPTVVMPIPSRGVAHSGAVSTRLQGALRSPTFTITHPYIAYRMTGLDTRVRLVLNNLQLIQNPIYGGLEIRLKDPGALKWHTQAVDKWIGQKAYIEVLDEGDGYAVLDRVVFSHAPVDSYPPHGVQVVYNAAGNSDQTLAQVAENLGKALLNPPADLPRAALVPSEWRRVKTTAEFDRRLAQFHAQTLYDRKAVVMTDGTPRDESVFLRGNPRKTGDVVPRHLLTAVAGDDQPAPKSGSGRLELARRMVDPANPLTARVIVNRVWKHHFGEGIVRTPDDFGNMGQPPSHPELLDFLAYHFPRELGWSLKKLHKVLLLTHAYQMSSDPADTVAEERDPQNRLWHRMPLKRLEAESIRDAMLAVSGRLDRTQFGPSVLPHLTPFMIGRGRPGQTGPLDANGRRSVYISVRRNFLTPLFQAFDAPVPFSTVGRRTVSNVPAQALALMNNPLVVQQATLWAEKTAPLAGDPDQRIRSMYETAFTRTPTADELASARAFVTEQTQTHGPNGSELAWADLAHVLFNVKEFIFVQ